MKRLTFKNCITAVIASGCLLIIAIIIVIFIVIRNLQDGKPLLFFNNEIKLDELNNDSKNDTLYSKLQSKDKQIAIKIGLISDTENYWNNTQKAIDGLENKKVNFIVHLGDVTKLGVQEDLLKAKEIFNGSSLKVYPVPGDRDLWKSRQTQEALSAFNSVFGESYRIEEAGGYKFLFIDNSNIYEGIDDKQWVFINDHMSDVDFIFLHNPIYFNEDYLFGEKGMGQFNDDVELQRQALLSLVRSSNVKAVIAGNQHFFSEIVDPEDKSLNHYVIGSLNSERNVEFPNFSTLTVYEDGDYYIEKIVL